jgi:ribosome maturation factor RimP
MVSAEAIRQLVEENPSLSKFFVVDIKVSKDNCIVVKADTDQGITIDECGELSTAIEASLNRDEEDFDLEVSSPGLAEPLRLPRQYLKNIGREVVVETIDGEKLRGVIAGAGDKSFTLEETHTERQGGKKVKVQVQTPYNYCDIKSTKLKIAF